MLRRYWIAGLSTAAMVASSALIANAAPKDDVQAALQKLADAQSYSWKTASAAPAAGGGGGGGGGGFGGGGPIEGKTEKDGYTWLSLTGRGGAVTEVLMKGENIAIKTDTGWMTAADLAANPGPQTRMLGQARTAKPALDKLKTILDKVDNVTKADDAYTFDAPEDLAKTLAPTFGGRPGGGGGGGAAGGAAPTPPTVTNAKATFKIWIADGAVSKLEQHFTGSIDFNGNARDIDQDRTTEISAVGSTKVDVPADVKPKLDAAPAAPGA